MQVRVLGLLVLVGLVVAGIGAANTLQAQRNAPAAKGVAGKAAKAATEVADAAKSAAATAAAPATDFLANLDAAVVEEVRKGMAQTEAAFNAGNVDALISGFIPEGEYIDENGTVYQGAAEIKALLTSFFAKYPGSKLSVNLESLRFVGPVAIEEGVRTITSKDDSTSTQLRFIAVRYKTPQGWQLVSLRDFSDDIPTPHDYLQPLAWLVGDWVNEGSDARVKINYRWSADGNFLLGEYDVQRDGVAVMNSTHRIGWDPVAGKIRSWLFDSDGGFGEGHWTQVGEEWVVKSTATLPDGQTGSATLEFVPLEPTRFVIRGTDRLAGNERQPDFEFAIVKQAPQPQSGK
ncbi:MAG: SgcJ/EcaC family oxidoreductase [Pirellulales bacterium]|nr:SgcJ/EcaC family oxidoreductase [Pirellulales bacterium]